MRNLWVKLLFNEEIGGPSISKRMSDKERRVPEDSAFTQTQAFFPQPQKGIYPFLRRTMK